MFGQFILLALLARLGNPFLVGAYTLATALLNPIFFFTRMGMRQAQASDGAEQFSFSTYYRLRNYILIAAVFASLALSLFITGSPTLHFVFFVVLASKLIEAQSDIYYGRLLQTGRQELIGASLILRSISSIVMFCLFYYFSGEAALALIGVPVGWLAIYLIFDRAQGARLLSESAAKVDGAGQVLRLFLILWPLALAGAFGQVQQALPRYLVGGAMGPEILGQIAPALQLHMMVGVLTQTISQSLLPTVSKNLREGAFEAARSRLFKLITYLAPLAVAGVVIAWAFGPLIVQIIFGSGYETAGALLGIASVSWSFRAFGMLFQNIAVGRRNFLSVLWLQMAITSTYAVALIICWDAFGLVGAFYGLAAGSAIHCLFFFGAAMRILASKNTVS